MEVKEGKLVPTKQEHRYDDAEAAQEVITAIAESSVTEYAFSGNTFGTPALTAVAGALDAKTDVVAVDFSDIFRTRLRAEIPPALEALAAVLKTKENLKEVNLSDNAFGPDGANGFRALLVENGNLERLLTSNCGLGIGGAKIIAEALLARCEANKAEGKPAALTTFIAGRNRLENDGITPLAASFAAMGTMKVIRVFQNGINKEGIIALAEALGANAELEVLDVNDNTVKAEGSKAIAAVLAKLPKLKTLDIGDCLMTNEGVIALAEALEDSCPDLEVLNLSFNEIEDDGAIALAKALGNKTKLKTLELDGNEIHSAGLDAIKSVLAALGVPDALGSMEDNEGSDDEDWSDEDDDDDVNDLAKDVAAVKVE